MESANHCRQSTITHDHQIWALEIQATQVLARLNPAIHDSRDLAKSHERDTPSRPVGQGDFSINVLDRLNSIFTAKHEESLELGRLHDMERATVHRPASTYL